MWLLPLFRRFMVLPLYSLYFECLSNAQIHVVSVCDMSVEINGSRPRVTGKMLADFRGQMVTLLGVVSDFDRNSRGLFLNTSDNVSVNVKFSEEALISEMTPNVMIEVSGQVDHSGTAMQGQCWNFVPTGEKNLDLNLYNLAVEKIHQLGADIYPHIDASQVYSE